MRTDWQQPVAQALRFALYASLGCLVLTFSWQTGWNILGDPYELGPYLPWLSLVFPLAGLGIWGAFFTQWTLGDLRLLHHTRWFYLLLFTALLMLNVLFSVNAEASLGWLSIWLTGCLALSLRSKRLFNTPAFWGWYALACSLSFGLWWFVPQLIMADLLLLAVWFATLHGWQQNPSGRWRSLLTLLALSLAALLSVSVGMQLLVVLSFVWLWAQEYRSYRRQNAAGWYSILAVLGLFIGAVVGPQFSGLPTWQLPSGALGQNFNWLTGVGWGQLEWAQYQAQTVFTNPADITTVWAGSRLWYEMGLLLVLWFPALWLLTLGHEQKNVGFRSAVFWGVAVLAPQLWLSPSGIILGCWWFFNRSAWIKPAEVLPDPNQ